MYSAVEIAQKIKETAKSKNIVLKTMLEDCGMNKNVLSTMTARGSIPQVENLAKIADYLGITLDYLLGRDASNIVETLPSTNIRMIPLFESVSAGFGAYADSAVIGYHPVYIENDYEAENSLAIKVKGNSMYPKIEDGDIVVVCKDIDYEDGSIVVALIDGDEGIVKKIKTTEDSIILESINPEYEPRVFKGSEMNRIHIVGVVRIITKLV